MESNSLTIYSPKASTGQREKSNEYRYHTISIEVRFIPGGNLGRTLIP